METTALHNNRRTFVRHLIEMLLAMFAGMLVLGGVAELAFVLAGSSLGDQSPSLQAGLMGVNMTVPMVWWMAHRGHETARSVEMAASMLVPTSAAIALYEVGALAGGAVLGVQHVVMIPAMVAVMLWRYDHYAGHH